MTCIPRRPIVVNYGLGVDSTAWLLCLLDHLPDRARLGDEQVCARVGLPADADLDDIIVVTAMTGSEHPATRLLVEQHMLPRLAAARLPYAQVARDPSGREHRYTLLDRTDRPRHLFLDGDYLLFSELIEAGTIPTTALVRMCSIHAKGWPIDAFVADHTGGRPFYQVMGFEASKHERKRAAIDAARGDARNPARTGIYPLQVLGWDRDHCAHHIAAVTGATWRKSACVFCPFRMHNTTALADLLTDYRTNPDLALQALFIEHTAVALHPGMGLIGGRRLCQVMAADRTLKPALDLFENHLDGIDWAVYDVRRALKAKRRGDGAPDRSHRGYAARYTRRLAVGSRTDMTTTLSQLAAEHGQPVDAADDPHRRVWLRRRALTYPTAEHLLTVAPAVVADKQGDGFDSAWAEIITAPQGPHQPLLA